MARRLPSMDRAVGLLVVLAVHAAAFWMLWSPLALSLPQAPATLFVDFIAPPPPGTPAEARTEPKPRTQPKHPLQPTRARQIDKPQATTLAVETRASAPADEIGPPPSAQPAAPIESAATPLPAMPLALSSELSVACPERPAPRYPGESRRRGERGFLVLRIELSESGHVASARVTTSSGHELLDAAALAAVRTWRCVPPTRNGQAVRAVAEQPFNFFLPES